MLHATLAGTPLNADQNRLLVLTRPITERWLLLTREYQAASAEQHLDPAFEAAYTQRSAALSAEYDALRKQFIHHYPQSQVSLDVLQQLARPRIDPAEAGPLFDHLAPVLR